MCNVNRDCCVAMITVVGDSLTTMAVDILGLSTGLKITQWFKGALMRLRSSAFELSLTES
jgi:hypothetical protein